MIKLFLISNMYPSEENPSYGVFVKNFVSNINATSGIEVSRQVVISKRGKGQLVRYLKFYLAITKGCLFHRFDLLYVHFPLYAAPILRFMPLCDRKLILNFHGSDVMGEGKKFVFLKSITQKICKRADLIVVPSSFIASELTKKFAVSENKIFISPSAGVDKGNFYPMLKPKAREQIKIADQYTIGFISRLDSGKGWDEFLDAIARLKKSGHFSFQALVVGGGQQKELFLTKLKTLELEENVIYAGRKKQCELNAYFNSLDIFVASSILMESLGLTGLEAMSCGVPVAGSDRAGIATYIENDSNGFLFKPGNVNALADILKKHYFLQDVEKKMLTKKAIETAKKYASDYVKKQISEKLISLVERRRK